MGYNIGSLQGWVFGRQFKLVLHYVLPFRDAEGMDRPDIDQPEQNKYTEVRKKWV